MREPGSFAHEGSVRDTGSRGSDCVVEVAEASTQTADDTDIVVPEGAEVINIPLPAQGTRWSGGDWDMVCRNCGDSPHPNFFIRYAHNAGTLHHRARRTYKRLKLFFPGSKIPFRVVQEFVANCPRCQANPAKWTRDINPIVRTVIPKDFRTRIGIDTLKITQHSGSGDCQSQDQVGILVSCSR